MIFLQSIVKNRDHDASSRNSLGPGTLYVHIQPLSPVLKRENIRFPRHPISRCLHLRYKCRHSIWSDIDRAHLLFSLTAKQLARARESKEITIKKYNCTLLYLSTISKVRSYIFRVEINRKFVNRKSLFNLMREESGFYDISYQSKYNFTKSNYNFLTSRRYITLVGIAIRISKILYI